MMHVKKCDPRLFFPSGGFSRRFSDAFAALGVCLRMLVTPHLPQHDSKWRVRVNSTWCFVGLPRWTVGILQHSTQIFAGWHNYKQGADKRAIKSKTLKSWHSWVGTDDLDIVGETTQLSLLWNFSWLLRRISFHLTASVWNHQLTSEDVNK